MKYIVVDTQVRENMLMFGKNKSEYLLRPHAHEHNLRV